MTNSILRESTTIQLSPPKRTYRGIHQIAIANYISPIHKIQMPTAKRLQARRKLPLLIPARLFDAVGETVLPVLAVPVLAVPVLVLPVLVICPVAATLPFHVTVADIVPDTRTSPIIAAAFALNGTGVITLLYPTIGNDGVISNAPIAVNGLPGKL